MTAHFPKNGLLNSMLLYDNDAITEFFDNDDNSAAAVPADESR
jgi:hypothetical protein